VVAAARVDRSGTGHAAGGIKGQILTATTTGIIAVDEPLAWERGVPSALTVLEGRRRTTAGEEGTPRPVEVIGDEAVRGELTMSLDELAREGARRMLAAALEAESTFTWPPSPSWSTSVAIGWCAATVTPSPPGRHRHRAGRGGPPAGG
jgi:hypothetical protein